MNDDAAFRLLTRLDAAPSPPTILPFRRIFPKSAHEQLFKACTSLLESEPTLLQLNPTPDVRVNVVGDTHGQLHDALKLLDLAGSPSETNWFVFNGDFVDRGAWGAELLAVAMAWKVAAPDHVFLLRGNHECEFCTEVYGYKRELQVKYGKAPGNALWRLFTRLGAALPLAARIGEKTLVLHGGLFRGRAKAPKKGGKKARKTTDAAAAGSLAVGTLKELAKASKGGVDPDGEGDTQIAGDVLWSDPAAAEDVTGLVNNDNRGIGTMFGPDATEEFLRTNGLSLVLRSHEGPDAREDRENMPDMDGGFSVDHDIEGVGKLCTVFSAPDYPQFIEEGERRHFNKATFVVLTAEGEWAVPAPVAFTAAKPRPNSEPYYDITVGGSDEEGPDGDLRVERADADEAEDEEDGKENGDAAAATTTTKPAK